MTAPRLTAALSSLFLLAGALAAACDDGTATPSPSPSPSPSPTATSEPGHTATPRETAAPPETATPSPPRLGWRDCGDGFECAPLAVPLDYADPDGQQIELGLVRLPASGGDRRIGSLVTNPGGPGGSGIGFLRSFASSFPREVRERFDLVSFDPRGVGESTPVVCHDNLQALVAADPSPDDDAEWAALVAENQRFADACAERHAGLLPHLGTRNVARDLDRIREALGDAGLTYVGFSYGTIIGAVYADLFPDRIRAMVLDGAVDLSLDGEALALGQAEGFERALAAFVANCDAAACDIGAGSDAGATIRRLFADVEDAPIPSLFADRPVGPGELMLGVAAALYDRDAWDFLDSALAQAAEGDGSSIIFLADALLQRNPDGSYPNAQEMQAAVNCLDRAHPGEVPRVMAIAEDAASRWPHFGAAAATGLLTCTLWPVPAEPLEVARGAGAPPILVIGTTRDPATPYEWSVTLADQLESGVLLTHDGDGHTVYAGDNRCVNETVNAYLIDIQVPEDGVTCR